MMNKLFWKIIKECVLDEEKRNKKYELGDFAIKNDGSVGLP